MATFSNLETLWRDARYGARMLRKNPSYAAVITRSDDNMCLHRFSGASLRQPCSWRLCGFMA